MQARRHLVVNNLFSMDETKRKQISKPGHILAIPLMDGKKFMYLQCLESGEVIFDLVTDQMITDLQFISRAKILFYTAVYKNVISSTQWPRIGKIDIKDNGKMPLMFAYDPLLKRLKYYQDGKFFGNPSAQDCYNLETVSVWDKNHIEERLEHYIRTGKDHPRDWDDYILKDWFKNNL